MILRQFLLAALLLTFSSKGFASLCEDEVDTLGALTRVLKAGLALGELNSSKILKRVLGEKIENPFVRDGRRAENLALAQGFARHLPRLKDSQLESFRSLVRDLMATDQARSESVHKAKDSTKYVLGIIAEELSLSDNNEPYISGFRQGRPVFIGKFKGLRGSHSLKLIDHFGHSTFKHRDVWGSNLKQGGKIFEWKGRSVYALAKTGAVHDLEDFLGKGPFPEFDLQLPEQPNVYSAGSEVVVTENSVRIVSSWMPKSWGLEKSDPTSPCGLGFAEWSDNPKPFQFVTYDEPELLMPFQFSTVSGRSILPYMVKGQRHLLRFYDFSTDQVYNLTAPEKRKFQHDVAPIVFARDGKFSALLPISEPGLKSKLGVTALGGNGRIEDLNLIFSNLKSLKQLEFQNGRFALIWTIESISLLDLQSMSLLWTIESNYKAQVFGQFQFRGEPYLIFGTKRGEVQIVEVRTGQTLNRAKVSDKRIVQINTFEIDGIPMAIIPGYFSKPPILLQLVKEESR